LLPQRASLLFALLPSAAAALGGIHIHTEMVAAAAVWHGLTIGPLYPVTVIQCLLARAEFLAAPAVAAIQLLEV
jgi:hypothetical protein